MSIYNSNNDCCQPDPCKNPILLNICDSLNLTSENDTVIIKKQGCNVDLSIDTTSIDKLIKINNGTCISIIKEYVNGVLNFTPVLDMQCIGAIVCTMCEPQPPPAPSCSIPTSLTVS